MAKKVKSLPKADVEAIFARFHEIEPEPKGELDYINAFTLLVAVVLSAQATDLGVNKATKSLFELAPSPAAMVALGQEEIERQIKTIGLFRTKAKNVFALSQLLLERHGGEVPDDREALEALPGVGRKTANVVLNIWFKQPTIAVDTHLFRVGNRTGPSARRDAAGGGTGAAQGHPAAIFVACASLADPARPLCLQGAQARMLALRYCRMVPV
ncbi:endonuclease III [Devosia sp. A8/3-2]|nr:endonuclease III [Devosia sp. A8/3-2]